ncbi:hypothetical protein [Metaclostridioides mangenotii]|uniref:Uncharacterized protein n=1 Tax=Metaclostridioides mangenotii TaxID=1540 RepID=A0ABS4EAU3_9FIRM|nr:hypothetical protein [Clostridioides mangenotii]MBP1855062.1 hypothetical protein [Clostridioides mangenotii]
MDKERFFFFGFVICPGCRRRFARRCICSRCCRCSRCCTCSRD